MKWKRLKKESNANINSVNRKHIHNFDSHDGVVVAVAVVSVYELENKTVKRGMRNPYTRKATN